MGGIVGIVSPTPDTAEQETIVSRMMHVLRHRGPDARGLTRGAHVVLGHRRLAVIDLTNTANQPLADADERYWIVYDGVLYNYPVRGDEEVIVGGYPAPPHLASQIFAQGIMANLVAMVTADNESFDDAIAWAADEMEGFMRA